MKKINYTLLVGAVFLAPLFTACEDFTDLQPKGKNLLTTTAQLEMLLNYEYYTFEYDVRAIAGDGLYADDVPNTLSKPGQSRGRSWITWDDSYMDLCAEATSSDDLYEEAYAIIGKVCNPVLAQVDKAEGSESDKKFLRSEALTLRAYMHYLIVNKFAKAYNPATAAQTRGIVYSTEDWNILSFKEQETIQQVYDYMLADLDEAIELDGLPKTAASSGRLNKACPHAVKALVLINMQRFDEAEAEAKKCLEIYPYVDDYNDLLTTFTDIKQQQHENILIRPKNCKEDLLLWYSTEWFRSYQPEAWARFEDGHLCKDRLIFFGIRQGNGKEGWEPGSEGGDGTGLEGWKEIADNQSYWNENGFKTTQMYLIIAEAEIRSGHLDAAMEALDAIRINRIARDVYQPLKGKVNTEAEAIKHLKNTSSGENIFSIYNFIQRKRWNQLDGWKETFTRTIVDWHFQITPESKLWVFPIPVGAMSRNPLLKQNYDD